MAPLQTIDTHCHLNLSNYFDDIAAVINRAVDAGVSRLIVIGIDLPSSEKAIQLAEDHFEVYATAGIHPNDCHKAPKGWESALLEMLEHPRVVGVGETGLDNYWKDSPAELQQRFFRNHLDMALATKVKNRYEYRTVKCEVIRDYQHGEITWVRTDTGEEIRRRTMRADERQQEMPV